MASLTQNYTFPLIPEFDGVGHIWIWRLTNKSIIIMIIIIIILLVQSCHIKILINVINLLIFAKID